jgi:hypothetical protein
MFDGCSNLQRITFEQGSALTSIQAHALENMARLNYIDFGDAKVTNIITNVDLINSFIVLFVAIVLCFYELPKGITII